MISIYKKEIRSYFTTMTGYVFLGFLVLLMAIFFSMINVTGLNPNYAIVLSNCAILFLILIPTLTMRLFAEETRQKTDQLIFTSPISVGQIVIGKFLAAFSLFVLGLLITCIFPMIITRFGELPFAATAGAYVGYLLLGTCFIAAGLLISALTENQVIAAVGTFAMLFIFYILNSLAQAMPADPLSSLVFVAILILALAFVVYDSTKNIYAAGIVAVVGFVVIGVLFAINNLLFDNLIYKVLVWFSVLSRFSNFNAGIFDLTDIVYYITFTLAFIYLTINVIEKRRWR